MFRSVTDAVLYHGKNMSDKLAVADARNAYTYGELSRLVIHAAVRMQAFLKGRRREYVLVECTQDAAFLIAGLACKLTGAVFVPFEKKMPVDRLRSICDETKAKYFVGSMDYSGMGNLLDIYSLTKEKKIQSDVSPMAENPIAEVLFTTGTTGKSKGVVMSHRANMAVAENIISGVRMSSDTVELIPLPLSHSHGLRTCYANLVNGSSVVITDGIMDIGAFFGMMEEYGVNALDMSPTVANILLKIAGKGLREFAAVIDYIEIGTAVLEDETKRRLKEIFTSARLYNFYGSTEAGRSCVLDFSHCDRTGCIGYPAKNAAFSIVDNDRKPFAGSEENPGLIAVSGGMMMDGYLGNRELTEKTLVNGVLYTNDTGYIDESGRVYVIGRKGDIINYKGIKIAPEEIERVAQEYDGIDDCACIPIADKVCGQVPKLFIKLSAQGHYDGKHFSDFLRERLGPERMPPKIEIIDEIPRSLNGKLLRERLKNGRE